MTMLDNRAFARMSPDREFSVVTLRWLIGRAPEHASAERTLTLRLNLDRDTFEATLGDEAVCAGTFVRVDEDDRAMVHFDCEGIFGCTIEVRPPAKPRLLFARTTLLTKLGIPGGRTGAPTVEVSRELTPQATRES